MSLGRLRVFVLFWFTRPSPTQYSSNALICPLYLLSEAKWQDFINKQNHFSWKFRKMENLVQRIERIQKIKKEIEIFAENNDVSLHPRLNLLIPWFNYSYSIFKRLTERQRNSFSEVQKLNFEKKNFKGESDKISVNSSYMNHFWWAFVFYIKLIPRFLVINSYQKRYDLQKSFSLLRWKYCYSKNSLFVKKLPLFRSRIVDQ